MNYNMTSLHPEQLLSSRDLEKITGLTTRFWDVRRAKGDSPPFIRISAKAVRYRWGDVSKWLDDRLNTRNS